MKLGGFLFLLIISAAIFAQQPGKASNSHKSAASQDQKANDGKQAAAKYVQKFLEFTSRTYEVFTDEFENFLSRPNAFFPEDEEGRIISEIQKQASDDVLRVYARARFKFAKTPGDTSAISGILPTIQEKFLFHFDSSAARVKEINKEQYSKIKSLPPEQLNAIAQKNKTSFDALLKKLSDICDKMGQEYDEYMRCNMIREALSQSGKGQVNW